MMFFSIVFFIQTALHQGYYGLDKQSFEHFKTKDLVMIQTDTATFGGGCFWCTEAIYRRIEGVQQVKPGYAAGETKNPTYNEVCSGSTGHAEVVQVVFQPEVITYTELLEIFFKTHDPTTINRQGADRGTQYRSIILYHNNEQKKIANSVIQELNQNKIWDNPIVTEVKPIETFYEAETYHHDYFKNNGNQPYCQMVIVPKIEKLEYLFKSKLKKHQM